MLKNFIFSREKKSALFQNNVAARRVRSPRSLAPARLLLFLFLFHRSSGSGGSIQQQQQQQHHQTRIQNVLVLVHRSRRRSRGTRLRAQPETQSNLRPVRSDIHVAVCLPLRFHRFADERVFLLFFLFARRERVRENARANRREDAMLLQSHDR